MKTPRRRDSGVSIGKVYYFKYPPNPFTKEGSRNPQSRDCGVLII